MFELGNRVATLGIVKAMEDDSSFINEVAQCMKRHRSCDWGIICDEDKKANDDAVINGDRILSAYETSKGKIWIITEADRSVTTTLFPHEY